MWWCRQLRHGQFVTVGHGGIGYLGDLAIRRDYVITLCDYLGLLASCGGTLAPCHRVTVWEEGKEKLGNGKWEKAGAIEVLLAKQRGQVRQTHIHFQVPTVGTLGKVLGRVPR